MVSVFVFYSDDPSSNPIEAYSFFREIVLEKNDKNKNRSVSLRYACFKQSNWPLKIFHPSRMLKTSIA